MPQMATSDEVEPSYTVFIRLPFPRGDFIDPPPVEWDATKDKALWKILSKASKNSDIDWNALATRFDVSLAFLLQQAAWLYERQFSQVRAQLRKVGAKAAPSPVLGTDSTGGEAMRRTGSGGGGPRAPSALSSRKDSPLPKIDTSTPGTPRSSAPPLSRTSSTGTAVQSRHFLPNSPRPTKVIPTRRSLSPISKARPSLNTVLPVISSPTSKAEPTSSSEPADSSSSESSSESDVPAQSRLLRRPPRFSSNRLGRSEDADEDDSPTFLPFSNPSTQSNKDPSPTLHDESATVSRRTPAKKSLDAAQVSQTSDSSASSAAPPPKRDPKEAEQSQRPSGRPYSRRTDELAGRSPLNKGKGLGREGSDGTPSMGSSFSDLDDASVTQSALEEALASNMQHGGMASRMSTISQALRSRYL